MLFPLIVSAWLAVGPAADPSVAAPALKAAFLYNFAKLAEWPAEALAPGAALRLCVAGDAAVADALAETGRDRTIEGHDLVVARVQPDSGARGCHLLYLAGLDSRRARVAADSLKGAPVLTVSDIGQFTKQGGIVELFLDGGKMRFAINVDAAQRAGLHFSSRLLSLARIVKDEGDAQR